MFEETPQLAGTNARVVNTPALAGRKRNDSLSLLMTDEYNPVIKAALQSGTLKLSDGTFYKVKLVDGRVVKLYETADAQSIGVSNIDKNKLEGDTSIVVSMIRLTAAVSTGTAQARADEVDPHTLDWYAIHSEESIPVALFSSGGKIISLEVGDDLPGSATLIGAAQATVKRFPGLESGEVKLQTNGTKSFITQFPTSAFARKSGVVVLDNPRVINPNQSIDFEIDLGADNPSYVDHDGITSALWIRSELIGTVTIPRGN